MRVLSAFLLCPDTVAADVASANDLRRARSKVPDVAYRGEGHAGMVETLNTQLKRSVPFSRDCSDFTVSELVEIQRGLLNSMQPEFNSIYQETSDNRQLVVFGKPAATIEDMEELWAAELEVLAANPSLHDISRDAKCHETIMWTVHHVPEVKKAALLAKLVLPLLATESRDEKHYTKTVPENVVTRVMDGYKAALGCAQCHATPIEGNTEFTIWPEEVHYTATGHGPFPFWDRWGPLCPSCDLAVNNSARMEVKYSSKIRAEILMHESCSDMTWSGADAPKNSPCNHIFSPEYGAFIYTPTRALVPEADGSFCCRTYAAHDASFPGSVPRNWMQSMAYQNTSSGYRGDHYSGDIKVYTNGDDGPLQFWYFETLEGKPVEQGEGCYQPGAKKKTACARFSSIMLWHEFNTFEEASFSEADFVVPDVCKSTTISCPAPPGSGPPGSEEIIV